MPKYIVTHDVQVDVLVDTGVFATTPKVRAWRAMLAQRASVQLAVGVDYHDRLRAFLARECGSR